jgi:hypothetical protein
MKNGAILSASPPSVEHAAVAYAPAVTTLTGVIVEQPYDDDASPSERGKAAWILKLEAPVAVEAKAGDAIDVAESDVTEIHLNADPSKSPVSKEELGRTRFQATGTLYHAHTTHHLRPIVMLVSDLEAERP